MPVRHQRKRTAGAKLPAGVVCVTRPGRFGNPFDTAQQFREVLSQIIDGKNFETVNCRSIEFFKMFEIAQNLNELRGKDLACWCEIGKPCHADVLIEFANRP